LVLPFPRFGRLGYPPMLWQLERIFRSTRRRSGVTSQSERPGREASSIPDGRGAVRERLLRRAWERFAFALERVFLRGAHVRLLAMAVLIGLVALAAGALLRSLDPAFGSFGEATWWAFLRLTDPGYLGDDEGAVRRTISTIVTVLGYVIFVGAVIAILTQWLNQLVGRLQSGLTPIAQRNHVVVLGWTTRTAAIVEELLLSGGVG
jgi:hypothetical protein